LLFGTVGGRERVREQPPARRPLLMLPRRGGQHLVEQRDRARRRGCAQHRAGAGARDALDEAMHPDRLVGARRQQRVAQQQLDRVVHVAGADGRVVSDDGVSVQQLARDPLRRQMRAQQRKIRGNGALSELLKRQAPHGRDRVLVPQRRARGKQLGRSVSQALQVAGEGDRPGVRVRGGLLQRQRQITQHLGDVIEDRGVALIGACCQERVGLRALPHIQWERPGVQRAPVRVRARRDEHVAAPTLGDTRGDRRGRRSVVEDQQPATVALKPAARDHNRIVRVLVDVDVDIDETERDGELGKIAAQRRRLLGTNPPDHVIRIAMHTRIARGKLRLPHATHDAVSDRPTTST
jgi:hypothetical protein